MKSNLTFMRLIRQHANDTYAFGVFHHGTITTSGPIDGFDIIASGGNLDFLVNTNFLGVRGTDMGLIRLQRTAMPSGSVIQTVTKESSAEETTTSNTHQDTSLTLSITPRKVIVRYLL